VQEDAEEADGGGGGETAEEEEDGGVCWRVLGCVLVLFVLLVFLGPRGWLWLWLRRRTAVAAMV